MPWRINSRLTVLTGLSCPSQIGTTVRTRMILSVFTPPNRADVRCVRAADVEREVPGGTWYLAFASALRQMQVRFHDLPHTGRADRMAVADESAAGIDEGRRTAFKQFRAFASLGETEEFVGDDLRDRKTIVYIRAVDVAGRQVRHLVGLLGGPVGDGERRRIFPVERQVVRGVTVTEQTDACPSELLRDALGAQHQRRAAVGDR